MKKPNYVKTNLMKKPYTKPKTRCFWSVGWGGIEPHLATFQDAIAIQPMWGSVLPLSPIKGQ